MSRPPVLALLALLQVPPVAAQTWSRTYESPNDPDLMYQAVPGRDGAYHAIGAVELPTRPGEAFVLKTDATGQPLWHHAYGSTSPDSATAAAATRDGGLVVVGPTTHGFDFRTGFVLRLDAAGAMLWARELVLPLPTQVTTPFAVAERTDGAIVVAGATSEIDTPPRFAWLVTLAPDGTLAGQSWWSAGGFEEPRTLAASSNDGYVLAGSAPSADGSSIDAWVMKLDPAFALQWSRTFGGRDQDEAWKLAVLPGGRVAVVGTTFSFTGDRAPWVIMLSPAGDVLWHRVFQAWGDAQAVALRDGGLLVAGRVELPGRTSLELWLALLGEDGSLGAQRLVAGDSGDFAASLAPLPDGGFLMGATWAWGLAGEAWWLLRLDAEGRVASCPMVEDVALGSLQPAMTAADAPAMEVALAFDVRDAAFTRSDVMVATTVRCDACLDAGGARPAEPSRPGPGWTPLLVEPGTVTFGQAAAALDYNVYVDGIGSWYAPSAAAGTSCHVATWTDNGDGTLTVDLDPPPDSWLVVTASNACGESSAGRDSMGAERNAHPAWQACGASP